MSKETVEFSKEEQDLLYDYRTRLLKANELSKTDLVSFKPNKYDTLPLKAEVNKQNLNNDQYKPMKGYEEEYVPRHKRSFMSSYSNLPGRLDLAERRNTYDRINANLGKAISETVRENLYKRISSEQSGRIKVTEIKDLESKIRNEGYQSVNEFTNRSFNHQASDEHSSEVLNRLPNLRRALESYASNIELSMLPQYQSNEVVEALKKNNKKDVKAKGVNSKVTKKLLERPMLKKNTKSSQASRTKTFQGRKVSSPKEIFKSGTVKQRDNKLWEIIKKHIKDCPSLAAELKKENLL